MKAVRIVILPLFLLIFTNMSYLHAQNKKMTVVLDAGHGGHDRGTKGYDGQINEKDIALSVTKKLGEQISRLHPEVEVLYTRSDDTFIPLNKRSKFANNNNADLFISIHCNGVSNSSPYGTETYIMGLHKSDSNFEVAKKENSVIYLEENYTEKYQGFDPSNPSSFIGLDLSQKRTLRQSIRMASLVEKEFTNYGKRSSRGVKQAGFWVISYNTMPSVLVELGFISNSEEYNFLISDYGQEQMVNSLFRAFTGYKNEFFTQDEGSIPSTEAPNKVDINEVIGDMPGEVKVPSETKKNRRKQKANKKNKSSKEKVVNTSKGSVDQSEEMYKIQLHTSAKKISKNNRIFKNLPVSYYTEKGLYKYVVYSGKSKEELLSKLNIIRSKGFKDAFIIKMKDGKRILN